MSSPPPPAPSLVSVPTSSFQLCLGFLGHLLCPGVCCPCSWRGVQAQSLTFDKGAPPFPLYGFPLGFGLLALTFRLRPWPLTEQRLVESLGMYPIAPLLVPDTAPPGHASLSVLLCKPWWRPCLRKSAGWGPLVVDQPAQPGEPTMRSSGSAVMLGRRRDPSNPQCFQPQNGATAYTHCTVPLCA